MPRVPGAARAGRVRLVRRRGGRRRRARPRGDARGAGDQATGGSAGRGLVRLSSFVALDVVGIEVVGIGIGRVVEGVDVDAVELVVAVGAEDVGLRLVVELDVVAESVGVVIIIIIIDDLVVVEIVAILIVEVVAVEQLVVGAALGLGGLARGRGNGILSGTIVGETLGPRNPLGCEQRR